MGLDIQTFHTMQVAGSQNLLMQCPNSLMEMIGSRLVLRDVLLLCIRDTLLNFETVFDMLAALSGFVVRQGMAAFGWGRGAVVRKYEQNGNHASIPG